jgi:CDGSH-type Zn-finger protein
MNQPCKVKLEQGKDYYWCACGKTGGQPFCDGAHKGTGIAPVKFTAKADGDAYLCGCQKAKAPVYCDGSHKDNK